MAQATEMEERVKQAMALASGSDEIVETRTTGHFGNPILLLETDLTRAGDMRKFLKTLGGAGILDHIMEQVEQRLDDECILHFRLDKQRAYSGELALAENRDVIDVGMKVAAYPARREIALAAVGDWFGDF